MAKPDRTFEVFPDKGGRYRWRSRGKNGRVTAVSGEDFASQGNARRAARREIAAITGGVSVVLE